MMRSRRARARLLAGGVAVAAAALLSGCGGSTSTEPAAPAAASAVVSEAPAPAPASEEPAAEPAAGEVPDPCALLGQDEIGALVGEAPGDGELNATADPLVRKVCAFPGGLIVGVTVGSQYDMMASSLAAAAVDGKTKDIPGVGDKAVFAESSVVPGVIQVYALQGDYFVDVTGTLTEEQGVALATAMLAAI